MFSSISVAFHGPVSRSDVSIMNDKWTLIQLSATDHQNLGLSMLTADLHELVITWMDRLREVGDIDKLRSLYHAADAACADIELTQRILAEQQRFAEKFGPQS